MISTVIYLIGKLLTFPGAYLKGFFEHLCGRVFGIPVESGKYIRMTDGCGHVEHDTINGKARNFFYCLLPGVFTSIIGTPLLLAGYSGLFSLKITFGSTTSMMFIIYCILFYFGFSLCANVYPLMDDALAMWHTIYRKGGANIFVKIILFLPCVNIVVGAFLEKYSLNVLIMIVSTAIAALFL